MKNYNLVFLHGFPFNSSSWGPQVEYFKNKCNVLAPDLRGHRNGPNEAGAWMIAHFAEDLKQLLVENKIEKAVICGLSMGGYVALHFAQQYPEMVAGLVLCDTQADADSNEVKDKRYITI
ncbi:MAG: alpha/beta hydrolase [Pseudobdellovibrio sp.]